MENLNNSEHYAASQAKGVLRDVVLENFVFYQFSLPFPSAQISVSNKTTSF